MNRLASKIIDLALHPITLMIVLSPLAVMYVVLVIAFFMALFSGDAFAEQGDFTFHTVSYHLVTEDMNNINPGIGYDVTDGLRVGAIYNSYEKPGVYAAGILQVHDRVKVGAGFITGYKFARGFQVAQEDFGMIPFLGAEVDLIKAKPGRPGASLIIFGEVLNLAVKY